MEPKGTLELLETLALVKLYATIIEEGLADDIADHICERYFGDSVLYCRI